MAIIGLGKSSRRSSSNDSVQVTPFLLRHCYSSAKRASICRKERLALTLRYLTTGNSQMILCYCMIAAWVIMNMHRYHSHLIIELDTRL